MRIATIAGIMLVSGSLLSVAQSRSPVLQQSPTILHVPPPSECPLDMHVRQGIGGKMMATDKDGAQAEMFTTRLRLLLNNRTQERNSQHMVKARVKVRGVGADPRILPADSNLDGRGNLAMTVTINLTADSNPGFSGDLVLPGFTAALMVELQSVTLDDGAVLTFSDSCRVPPDGLMPVGEFK